MKLLSIVTLSLTLAACNASVPQKISKDTTVNESKLAMVVESMSDEHKARHSYRNPLETLSFFGVKPGDTVVEALPGGGWYSKILLPYLGQEGELIGVDYSADMWPHFGGFATPEFIESRKQWIEKFPTDAKEWTGPEGAQASAYTFASIPQSLTGKADFVLYIRALHNLSRFEEKGEYLSKALKETYRVLKPGGHVGIVQHALDENKPDEWAKGDKGYLKRSFLIEIMKQNNFEFAGESEINQNPKDDVQEGDVVWRLPPSLRVDESEKEKNANIGESNRMTLLFRKKS